MSNRLWRARVLGLAIAVAATLVAAVAALGVRSADACSFAGPSWTYVRESITTAPIVVVGTWVETSERVATLKVDEGLRGAASGARLRVDNRDTYTAFACSPYEEPFRKGDRFPKGARWLVALEKQEDGLWQLAYLGLAAWPMPDDELAPLFPVAVWYQPQSAMTRDQLRAAVAGVDVGSAGAAESNPPCNRTSDLGAASAMADSVVIARLGELRDGVARVEVVEQLGGVRLPESVRVNFQVRRDWNECKVVESEGASLGGFDGLVLLFLRPDDRGRADHRPVVIAPHAVPVNERYVTWGWPTVADIRSAVGASPAAAVRHEDAGTPWRWIAAAGGLAIVVAAVLRFWRRHWPGLSVAP